MYKAQVSRPDSNNYEWPEEYDGWMPGWHTIKTGTQEECNAVIIQYRQMDGIAITRVVPTAKRDDED